MEWVQVSSAQRTQVKPPRDQRRTWGFFDSEQREPPLSGGK
jgi:hypothetical protein